MFTILQAFLLFLNCRVKFFNHYQLCLDTEVEGLIFYPNLVNSYLNYKYLP